MQSSWGVQLVFVCFKLICIDLLEEGELKLEPQHEENDLLSPTLDKSLDMVGQAAGTEKKKKPRMKMGLGSPFSSAYVAVV